MILFSNLRRWDMLRLEWDTNEVLTEVGTEQSPSNVVFYSVSRTGQNKNMFIISP